MTSTSSARVRKKKNRSFSIYIRKVLGQVHRELKISSRAMAVMNQLIYDTFERICEEAAFLARYTKHVTLSSRDIQTAVRLIFSGDLAKYATAEGIKAVVKINGSK